MNFSNEFVSCIINIDGLNVSIKGSLINPSLYKKKVVIAPAPISKMTSYSGSALPYPNEEIAFENTKNIFEISDNGVIDTIFQYPNSYYSQDGITKIKSPIIIIFDENKYIIELNDLCPLKTLRDRKRGDPIFYALKELILPVGTAEETMKNYSAAKIKYNIA